MAFTKPIRGSRAKPEMTTTTACISSEAHQWGSPYLLSAQSRGSRRELENLYPDANPKRYGDLVPCYSRTQRQTTSV